jgi:hypothetical protein
MDLISLVLILLMTAVKRKQIHGYYSIIVYRCLQLRICGLCCHVTLSKGFVFSAGVNSVCTFIHTMQGIHDIKLPTCVPTGWSPGKPVSNINGELLIFLVTT